MHFKHTKLSKFAKLLFVSAIIQYPACFSQAPVFQWVNSYGNSLADDGKSINVDGSGNVYAIGEFRGTVDFDPGPGTSSLTSSGSADIYITKLNNNGNLLWAKRVGTSSTEVAGGITLDPVGNVLITGSFSGTVDFDPGLGISNLISSGSNDVFVLKLDGNGNYIWARNMGGTSADNGMAIVTNSSGDVFTTGEFNSTGDFDPSLLTFNITSAGSSDIFVSKLDASGNFVWAKSFGGSSTDIGLSIATNSLGIFFTGYFQGIADFDPSSSTFNLNSAGSNDVFICRLNTTGNLNFAVNVGGTGADISNSISLDANTAIIIAGQFNGNADFDPTVLTNSLSSSGSSDVFVAKYSNSGTFIWARRVGGPFADYGLSVSTDASNNIYTTGTFKGTTDFDPSVSSYTIASNSGSDDAFIHHLDMNGNFMWVKSFGGSNDENSNSISLDNLTNIYTTGSYQSTVDFDPDVPIYNLTSLGNSDIYIHKMGPCVTPPVPINTTPVSNLTICSGQFASLSVSGSGLITWYPTALSTTSLAIGNNYITPALGAGTYSYYIEASTCTISTSRALITVTVNACAGLFEPINSDFQPNVFPNPSIGIFNIDLIETSEICVYDALGSYIFGGTFKAGKHQFDITKYSGGIYFIKTQTATRVRTFRLLKE